MVIEISFEDPKAKPLWPFSSDRPEQSKLALLIWLSCRPKILPQVHTSYTRPTSTRNTPGHVLVGLVQQRAFTSGERNLEASGAKTALDSASGAVVITASREPAAVATKIERRSTVGEVVECCICSGAIAAAEVANNGAADHLWLRGIALLKIGVGDVDGLEAVEAKAVVIESVSERFVRVVAIRHIVTLCVAVLVIESVGVVALSSCARTMDRQAENEDKSFANVPSVSLAFSLALILADLLSQVRSS